MMYEIRHSISKALGTIQTKHHFSDDSSTRILSKQIYLQQAYVRSSTPFIPSITSVVMLRTKRDSYMTYL